MTSLKTAVVLLICIINIVSAEYDSSCNIIYDNSPRYQLKTHLFCEYDPSIRSSNAKKDKTNVKTIIKMIFADFDEEKNGLTAHTRLTLEWNDPHLTWDPSDFGGLNKTYVKAKDIWVPNMYSVNPKPEEMDQVSETTCILRKTGQIRCRLVKIFITTCESDFTYWPYNTYNCTIEIGAWSYTQNEVDMHYISGIYTKFFDSHPQWKINMETVGRRSIPSKYIAHESFATLLTQVVISKEHTSLGMIVISPAIILTVLNLTTLWLRVGSVERLITSCVSFLGHLLAFNNVNWNLPDVVNTIPNILIFYVNSFILSMIMLVITCWLQNLLNSKKEVPVWLATKISPFFNSNIGQMLSINILDSEASSILQEDNDNTPIQPESKTITWENVVAVISWISFVIFIFVYIVMCAVLLR